MYSIRQQLSEKHYSIQLNTSQSNVVQIEIFQQLSNNFNNSHGPQSMHLLGDLLEFSLSIS